MEKVLTHARMHNISKPNVLDEYQNVIVQSILIDDQLYSNHPPFLSIHSQLPFIFPLLYIGYKRDHVPYNFGAYTSGDVGAKKTTYMFGFLNPKEKKKYQIEFTVKATQ